MARHPFLRRRVTTALVLTAIFAYEGYALFVKRSGETAFHPPPAEIQLSPRVVALQEHVVAPLWQRLHPLLWRLSGRPAENAA